MFPSSNSMNVVAGEMNVQTSSINSMIMRIYIYVYNTFGVSLLGMRQNDYTLTEPQSPDRSPA